MDIFSHICEKYFHKRILKPLEEFKCLDTANVAAMSHPVPMTNVFREDIPGVSLTAEQALSGAPAVEDERFRVPRILDEE